MTQPELLFLMLLALGWIVLVILRRVFGAPRPLGTIADEPQPDGDATAAPPPEAPDIEWGRGPEPPSAEMPLPAADEPFPWSEDAAQPELEVARQWRERQARLPTPDPGWRPVHPHRPRLRTVGDLRRAVVAATVLGPCRAQARWEPPEGAP